jgi:PAS domain S-box-containing protein
MAKEHTTSGSDVPTWPQHVVLASGAYAVATGFVALLGWALDMPRLTDWKNDGISMFPNTALCAAMSGVAILAPEWARSRTVVRCLAMLVALIGGLTLFEHISGVDLGIDTLLFERPWGQRAAAAPMRMGPPGSVSFLMTGAALLLLTYGAQARRVSVVLGVAVVAIGVLSFTGHLYGASPIYMLPRLTGVAMPTASAVTALGLGVLASVPEREPMRTLLDRGAAGVVTRRALPTVVVLALMLGAVLVFLEHQGLVDGAFGTALRTVFEIALLTGLLWWAAARVRTHEKARQRSDVEMRRRADELAAFLETAPIALHRVGPEGKILWANAAELRMLGYSAEEYVGHQIAEFHVDPDISADILTRVRRGETLRDYPARMKGKDGSVKTVLIDSSVFFDEGRFVHMQCFTRDITARAKAEETRSLLAAIVESSDDAIISKDLNGVITSWNRGAERVFGYSAEEAVGKSVTMLIPPERHNEEASILERVRRGERIDHHETVRQRKDGTLLDIALTVSPIVDGRGEVLGASKIARDITAANLDERLRARLAAIVESSDDAIVSKDLKGVITSWNNGAERLFGYSAEEAVGKSVTMLIPPDRHDEEPAILARVSRGERIDHYETVRRHKNGTLRYISLTVSPLRDEHGRIIGASKIARDITERKRAAAQREELLRTAQHAREEAEAANRAKDEFLAMLGHELRNPLSAVRNAIAAAALDESSRLRAIEIARRQTDQLARIVDDLLDVARMTQGRVGLRKQRVVLADVLHRAVDGARAMMDQHGHSMTLTVPAETIRLEADAARLEQAVANLLANAAKYTDAGGTIAVSAERDGQHALIRVRDNGIGMAPEVLRRVFDLFAQGERSIDRAQGGLGIGLTVVRRIVELHGGTVEAKSPGLGGGAEFVITLPALPEVVDESTVKMAEASRGQRREGRPARVLMAEDHPDAAESLVMILELLGHHVRLVHDGVSALAAARANPPDIMLVDIGLPGMSGYEVAAAIRRDPALKHVVLVALTGYGRPEDKAQALAAGFDYHLAKPVDLDALGNLVARLGSRVDADGSTTRH